MSKFDVIRTTGPNQKQLFAYSTKTKLFLATVGDTQLLFRDVPAHVARVGMCAEIGVPSWYREDIAAEFNAIDVTGMTNDQIIAKFSEERE